MCLLSHPSAKAQQNNPLIHSGDLLDRGSERYDSGDYRKAISLYRQIDRNDTNYTKSLYRLAMTYAADSQFRGAYACSEKGLSLGTDPVWEPELYNQYANAIDANGQPERALRVFDSAIGKYPAFSLLYINKASLLLRMKRPGDAESVLQQALLIDPYANSGHFKLAIATLQQGKLIPAFLSLISYLLMTPEGKYCRHSINLLNAIAHNEDEIQGYIAHRTETPSDSYMMLEQILQSRIALDKGYKPLTRLDDPIPRQIQVAFEKMEYSASDPDFYTQYYIPYFKGVFTSGQFEVFLNHIFTAVNMPLLTEYRKKNKKQLNEFAEKAAEYFNLIRATRELNYTKRNADTLGWLFSEGKLFGRGKYEKNGAKMTGPWKFYTENGNISATGAFNEQGRKDGAWTFYYFKGQIRGQEFYRDGKQEGDEIYYSRNGLRSSHSRYMNSLKEGTDTTFFLINAYHEVTNYKGGKEEGKKITYFSNGSVSYEENFTAGKLNGPTLSWFMDGQMEFSANYSNGQLEGPYKKYYSSSQLREDGSYLHDKQVGAWKFYHVNGRLKNEMQYTEGKPDGAYKEYYDNGQLSYELPYSKGKVNGEARYYDDDGKLFSTILFDNDQINVAKYFDKSGTRISQSGRNGHSIDLIAYHPYGYKRTESHYNAKGDITGTRTYYYPSGSVSEKSEYADGYMEGADISYYPNGQIKQSINYKKGEKDGYQQSYFAHGRVQAEGWIVNGKAQGYWLTYDEMGALKDSSYYLNNTVHGYKTQYLPDGRKEYESKFSSGWLEDLIQFDSTGGELQHCRFPAGAGKYKLVYPDGKPYIEMQFKYGNMEGPRHVYYFDGKLMIEDFYRSGEQDSTFRTYFHSGVLSQEGHYHLGQKSGLWKYYWEGGKLSRTEEYRNGKLNGLVVYYNEAGGKDQELAYKDDGRNGVDKRFDPDGTLAYQLNFKDDNPVSYTYLDKNGQLLPPIPLPPASGPVKTLFPNGNVSATFTYKDGFLQGPSTVYHSNGKVRVASAFDYGNTEGMYKVYYPNGQLKAGYAYLHGNLHGPYKEYNQQGTLTEEGNYYNSSQHGLIKRYDEKGILKQTERYYYGKLLSVIK